MRYSRRRLSSGLTNVNSLIRCLSLLKKTIAATINILGTYMHQYDCSSIITLLCDLDLLVNIATVSKVKCLLLMNTSETKQLKRGPIAYTFKCSRCNASIQPSVFLTFIHGPVILPYIAKYVKYIISY